MKTFTSKTLIYCCQLMIAGSICYAEPENIDFKIQVFRTPSKIGSHFQEKLLDHSTTANAIEKMPLLIQKGQARLEMEFEKTLPEKSPSKLNSTNGKFTSDDDVDHELGIQLEVRPILNPESGHLECAMVTNHVAKFDDGVKTLKTLSVFDMQSGLPKMIDRWQEADTSLFLIMVSRFKGKENKQQNPNPSLYAYLGFGDPDSKSKVAGEGFSGIVQIIKSGQVSTCQVEYPVSVKVGGKWTRNVGGWTAELRPLCGNEVVTSMFKLNHVRQDRGAKTEMKTNNGPVMIESCDQTSGQSLNLEIGKAFDIIMNRKDQLNSVTAEGPIKVRCTFLNSR
jgi:hypothetical protein